MDGTNGLRPVDLTLDAVRATCRSVVSAAGRGLPAFGVYVFGPEDPGASLAVHIERNVFRDDFANTDEALTAEYGPYEANSMLICVIDHRRLLPVGSVRLLVAGGAGFKSLNDLVAIWGETGAAMLARTGVDLDPAATWDVATLSVDRSYRNGLVSLALFQALGTGARAAGIGWFVSILDLLALRLVQLRTMKVFSRFRDVEPRPYLGSPSLPVYADLVTYRERLVRTDPLAYELLCGGAGIEPAISTPDWAVFAELHKELVDLRRPALPAEPALVVH